MMSSLTTGAVLCREVRIALSCQYPWNVNMLMLKEAAHHGHSERTATLTQSVLMGAHKRFDTPAVVAAAFSLACMSQSCNMSMKP